MLTEKTFDAGDVTLRYVEGPASGPPLVLLHGIGQCWQSFLPIMPALAFRYHLFALDLRGHGQSGHVPDEYEIKDYTRDTSAFVRTQVKKPAILLGHSLGGLIAIEVAAHAPDAIQALVLEDTPLFSHRGERLRARANYQRFILWRDLAQTDFSIDAWVAAFATLEPSADVAALRFRAKALSWVDPDVLDLYLDGRATDHYDIHSLLPQLTCPVFLIRSDPAFESAITDEDTKQAQALLKDLTLVSLLGVGHFIHTSQPQVFLRLVTDFCESLSS